MGHRLFFEFMASFNFISFEFQLPIGVSSCIAIPILSESGTLSIFFSFLFFILITNCAN